MNTPSPITDFARLIQRYFCSYLINQRRVSQHTVRAYRDSFRLLLSFVSSELNKPASALSLADINAKIILSFLQYLEEKRGCTAQTRNARLSAIRSFLGYVAVEEPQMLPDIQRVLAIPDKRTDRFAFEYLEQQKIDVLLKAPDVTTWSGQRDHILLLTLYNTGARVSEISKLQVKDIDLQNQRAIHLHGKGRKERIIPLWAETVAELGVWLGKIRSSPHSPLFPNRRGEPITRFGIRQRLNYTVQKAVKHCPSLKGKKISPHCIRHATAMNLLQSGVDLTIIALWLGHEKIETTHQYMEANLEMKEKALAMLSPVNPGFQGKMYTPPDDILTYLESL